MKIGENEIANWIPHLINILTTVISNYDNISVDVEMNPLNGFIPTWMEFINYNNYNKNNTTSVHNKVACDVCNISPIRGARYKCSVCKNFDMCEKCESKSSHDKLHPMIKIYEPVQSYPPNHMFYGWGELMRHWNNHVFNRFWPNNQPINSYYNRRIQNVNGRFGRDNNSQQWGFNWNNNVNAYDSQLNFNQNQNGNGKVGNKNKSDRKVIKANNNNNNKKKRRVVAEFVRNVTLPDRSSYPIDTIMQKTWEMKNGGEVEWGDNVTLSFFKGNKSLTLEENFPVKNAQPGETVKLHAMIKTPRKGGRYCTYYRLMKNGEHFGPRVWVDIFAVEQQNNSKKIEIKKAKTEVIVPKKENLYPKLESNPKNKAPQGNFLGCVCGAPLVKTTPVKAYDNKDVRVNCDICGKYCNNSSTIYHCPRGNPKEHPEGYDLCCNCVDYQIKSLKLNEQKKLKQQKKLIKKPEFVNNGNNSNNNSKNNSKNNINNSNNNNNNKSTSEDPLKGFPYAEHAKTIMNMGVSDVEKVKYLLMKANGEVEVVINELFGN